MKKYYLFVTAATILAACTQNDTLKKEVSGDNESTLISFETYHSKSTKATVETETDLTEPNNGFGVYAYKYSPNDKYSATNTSGIRVNEGVINLSSVKNEYTNPVFNNTMIYYNKDYNSTAADQKPIYHEKFTYKYPRYWDKEMYYAFFAYAPQSSTGVTFEPVTGLFKFTNMHKIQRASDALNKEVGTGENSSNISQYQVIAKSATNYATSNNAAIKDYLLAPCQSEEKWHGTTQMSNPYLEGGYEKANITVGFNFSHMLSKLNVSVKAKQEWKGTYNDVQYNGHEYQGIKNIYITKLEITNLPELTNLSENYLTSCQQNKVDFAHIYDNGAITFNPSNYTTSLGIVSPTTDNPVKYSINGETATTTPLYILAGGNETPNINPGNKEFDGYIDQLFTYYVAPNTPSVTDPEKPHVLKIEYYIEYLDNYKEKLSREIDLSNIANGANDPYNFNDMKPSYVYNINVVIGLDQIYLTATQTPWDDTTTHPENDIYFNNDEF